MTIVIIIFVCFFASAAGSICGIGGGVLIRPILDATGRMDVASVSFLSGCTVLSMSAVSLYRHLRNNRDVRFDKTFASVLAVGSVFGGILGKSAFQYLLQTTKTESQAAAIQAFLLLILTAGTLAYELYKENITARHVQNRFAVFLIGYFLGLLSAFLGIGGGPFHLIALFYLFSLKTKDAALYSIYIILFSQAASLCYSIFSGNVPAFRMEILLLMTGCGILGGLTGSAISQNIDHKMVDRLFTALMALMILISLYNIYRSLSPAFS